MRALTARQCLNVAKLFKGGMTIHELAAKYAITTKQVENIIRVVMMEGL